MSPTVMYIGPYRLYFFSREEARMHVHIDTPTGQAKFWLEPIISLADYTGKVTKKELQKLQQSVEDNHAEIEKAWKKHFKT